MFVFCAAALLLFIFKEYYCVHSNYLWSKLQVINLHICGTFLHHIAHHSNAVAGAEEHKLMLKCSSPEVGRV